ncbi:hypothetical protein V1514DRAFT_339134 [Lipomyces japonicus]|uniref:uncharacterized protein n=1 Tax=Lipomyces japonicus TaxID=56871 RepID=UPI0034CFE69B
MHLHVAMTTQPHFAKANKELHKTTTNFCQRFCRHKTPYVKFLMPVWIVLFFLLATVAAAEKSKTDNEHDVFEVLLPSQTASNKMNNHQHNRLHRHLYLTDSSLSNSSDDGEDDEVGEVEMPQLMDDKNNRQGSFINQPMPDIISPKENFLNTQSTHGADRYFFPANEPQAQSQSPSPSQRHPFQTANQYGPFINPVQYVPTPRLQTPVRERHDNPNPWTPFENSANEYLEPNFSTYPKRYRHAIRRRPSFCSFCDHDHRHHHKEHHDHYRHHQNKSQSVSRDKIIVIPQATGAGYTMPGMFPIQPFVDPIHAMKEQNLEKQILEREKKDVEEKHKTEIKKLETNIKELVNKIDDRHKFITIRNDAMKKRWIIPLAQAKNWNQVQARIIEVLPRHAARLINQGYFDVRRHDGVNVLPMFWSDVVEDKAEYEIIITPPPPPPIKPTDISGLNKGKSQRRSFLYKGSFANWFGEKDKQAQAGVNGRQL